MWIRDDRYGVELLVPSHWVAIAGHSELIPVDTWEVRGDGVALYFTIAWLPRRGRHSASFPGGRNELDQSFTLHVGVEEVFAVGSDREMRVDFDLEDLALSLRVSLQPNTRALAEAVLATMRVAPGVRAAPSAERRALDLARAWCEQRKLPSSGIVWTHTAGAIVHLTAFHDGGLLRIDVDTTRDTVTEIPLDPPDPGGATPVERLAAVAVSRGQTPVAGPPARLVIVVGDPVGQRYALGADNCIGRAKDCLVAYASATISRRHARVFHAASRYWIDDLGSSTGTFINGQRATSLQALKPGDVITVGDLRLRFEPT